MRVPAAAEVRARLAALDDRSTPSLRRVRRELSRELRELPARDVLRFALTLLDSKACPRWWAYEVVHHHGDAMASLSAAWLTRLGKGLTSWDEVDPFACYLLGPAWREGHTSDAHLKRWATSRDRWRRRAALVATVALNNTARGGRGDANRTLAICDLLASDRDELIVKAFSWALRELAGKQPVVVQAYLTAHPTLPPRVLREVTNKLTTGTKRSPQASASSPSRMNARRRSSRK